MQDDKNLPAIERMRFEALVEEYRILQSNANEHANMISSRENLFVTLSFSILAYTVAYDIETIDLILASIVSIGIFIYYVHAFERSIYVIHKLMMRCKEIENCLADMLEMKCIQYQSIEDNSDFIDSVMTKRNARKVFFLSKLFMRMGSSLESRDARFILLIFLIILWMFRIG